MTHPLAGKPAPQDVLTDIAALLAAYQGQPDVNEATQRVAFGTSGHRGSALKKSFNEAHILAISQAVCEYRAGQGITGPLFLGMDSHALSAPAQQTCLEVLAANNVEVRMQASGGFTPTPVISHNIRARKAVGGINMTASHNPAAYQGLKFSTSNGAPAHPEVSRQIEANAARLQAENWTYKASAAGSYSCKTFDPRPLYLKQLRKLIDFEAIEKAGARRARAASSASS